MGLLSIFKRQGAGAADQAGAASSTSPDAVAAARSRARQRLIGATLLLAVGVLGFPLLFETQPRPIAVDIPIEIPNKDRSPPLVMAPAPAAQVGQGLSAPAEPQAPSEQVERAHEQGREVAPSGPPAKAEMAAPGGLAEGAQALPGPAASAVAQAAKPVGRADAQGETQRDVKTETKAEARQEPRPEARAANSAEPRTATKPAAPASKPGADAARAQALLDGKNTPAAPAAAGEVRAVVQVGAFSDPAKLREARSRVEALGLKTYTQVVEVNGERRTRVRVGPFASRSEADKAAARIKSAGLPAAILTL